MKNAESLVPMVVSEVTITMEITVAIKAYSIAVEPPMSVKGFTRDRAAWE
jgi:hypothetical protein